MPTLLQDLRANVRELFTHDIVYASFWLAIVIITFFFPVMLGWQSLAEAVPTFYSSPSPNPNIKTPWQVDGGWHVMDVIPLTRTGIQAIKERALPFWAPYSGGGESPAVSNVVGLYYPLRLVFFSLWDSAHAFDWYFILRFFIAGLGMFFYLRIIGLRRIVSLWGGIAYAFTGYFILYLTYSFLDIDSLLPWTLLAIEHYFREKRIRYAALIGFFLAMTVVIGQPQSTIIAALFAGLYFVWKSVLANKIQKEQFSIVRHSSPHPRDRGWKAAEEWQGVVSRNEKRKIPHLGGCGDSLFIILVALLIASPFIADFLTFASEGATIAAWQSKGLLTFNPIQILHFLITPTAMPEVAAAGHLFDRYEIIIPYIGISVLILFLLSFFIKKKPPQLAPLYVWTALVMLKNAGFPLVQWIGKLPILSQIGWYKAYGPMAGAMVICAAISFEYILRERHESPAIWWRGFYKLIAIIPLAFVTAYVFAQDAFFKAYIPNFDFFSRHPEAIKKVVILLSRFPAKAKEFALYVLQNHGGYFTVLLFVEAIVFAAGTLIIVRYLRHKSRYAALAMVVFTAFELFLYMPKIRDGFHYLDPYAKTPPYVCFLQNQMGKEGVSRTFSLGDIFQGHVGELYKIGKAQNNSAVKPRRYFAYLPDEILREHALTGAITADKLPEVPQKFFDAYDIRYLISEETFATRPGLELIYDADLRIYRNNSALPKAYVVFQKETASSPENAKSIFYGASFDPHTAVILEDQQAISLPKTNAPLYSSAVVTRYTNNEVDLTAKTDKDGILVLTDLFYPGWQAYLDGKKVATYPANVMFRGIFLPAGSHTVTFVYEPWWFWPSVTVSLLTICGMIILAIYSSRKKIGVANTAV